MIGYITFAAYIKRIPPHHRQTAANGTGRINGGEWLEIVSDSGEWTRVRYGGHDGYVMSKFITTGRNAQPDPMPP